MYICDKKKKKGTNKGNKEKIYRNFFSVFMCLLSEDNIIWI